MLDKSTYRALKQKIKIAESYEEILEIPSCFARFTPHSYEKLNAPYGNKSPFYLRSGVIDRLYLAQEKLETLQSGYRLKIFDAYRPLSVQRFMIEYDTNRIANEKFATAFKALSKEKQMEVEGVIAHFWSPISDRVELGPPPHSTGGALDLTIIDSSGVELKMGTSIDALVDASESDYYDGSNTVYDRNRNLLVEVMSFAGFIQLPTEWWHFSYGDQIWAVDKGENLERVVTAKYGLM